MMKFVVERGLLFKALQLVAGAVEKRQTLPVLSNVLIRIEQLTCYITATDLEIELTTQIALQGASEDGATTIPARKLIDICRTLPESASLELTLNDNRITLKSGNSRFILSTRPASDFPTIESGPNVCEYTFEQSKLRQLIDSTGFSMAQQDVRYFLNGLLFEFKANTLRAVATDGHRLAFRELALPSSGNDDLQIIIPRKGVTELLRLLEDEETPITLSIADNHLRLSNSAFTFTSKLIDGTFPDYQRVIPKGSDKSILVDKEVLKQVFTRAAVLTTDKFKGVRLSLTNGLARVSVTNPEQEEVEEELALAYQSDELTIGFNVTYLLDILNTVPSGDVKLHFSNAEGSILVEAEQLDSALFVIMPMRL